MHNCLIYLEIYDNKIHNFLCDDNPNGGLEIIDCREIIGVRGLKSIKVKTTEDALIHMEDLTRQRSSNLTEGSSKEMINSAICSSLLIY